MTHPSKWFLLFAVVFVFNSCRYTQPTAPEETATIYGRVKLGGNPIYFTAPSHSGVVVTIEGTKFSTVSDDSGYFSFQDVPTGTYNVRFSKAGYGDIRWMSTAVAGGGNAPIYWYGSYLSPIMYKISNVVATLRSIEIKDTALVGRGKSLSLIAQGSVTPDLSYSQVYNGILLLVSHTSDVSNLSGHYSASFILEGGSSFPNGDGAPIDTASETFFFPEPTGFLNEVGFSSGDSIYVVAYGAPYYQGWTNRSPSIAQLYVSGAYGDYYDPTIQQSVFTSINQTPSRVIGMKIP